MREFNAYNLEDWPRMKSGDIIFKSTKEAIYYANLVDDRLVAYDLLKKWRKKTLANISFLKSVKPFNFNRLMDLAVRAQLYREAMEEIQRINESEVI